MDRDEDYGCIHMIFKNGRCIDFNAHLQNIPNTGNFILHLKPDAILSIEEFKKTHPEDIRELECLGVDNVT